MCLYYKVTIYLQEKSPDGLNKKYMRKNKISGLWCMAFWERIEGLLPSTPLFSVFSILLSQSRISLGFRDLIIPVPLLEHGFFPAVF